MSSKEMFTSTSQVLLSTPAPNFVARSNRKLSQKAVEGFQRSWNDAVKDIPLPRWCDAANLAKFLARETEQYYIEKRLDEQYERLLKTSRNVGEFYINYAEALTDYSNSMIATLQRDIERRSQPLYHSDFPLSLLTKFDLLKHTQIQAYDCLATIVNSFLLKASIYKGNNLKFDKNVSVPATEKTSLLVDAFNESDKAGSALLTYIRVWNAEKYSDLLAEKPLTKSPLDPMRFSRLHDDFEAKLYGLRNTLLRLTPETYSRPKAHTSSSLLIGELMVADADF